MEKEELSKLNVKTYVASGAINIEHIDHVENLFPGNPEVIASVLGGKKVAKKELTDDDLRNKIDALFLHLGLLGEVQKDMFPKDDSASVAASFSKDEVLDYVGRICQRMKMAG